MKITIITLGSRGDVQPFVALGRYLQQAGHETVIVGADDFDDFVEGYGLPYHPLGLSVRDAAAAGAAHDLIREGNSVLDQLLSGEIEPEQILSTAEIVIEAATGSDLILSTSGYMAIQVQIAAEKLGLPVINAFMSPYITTREHPNLLTWRVRQPKSQWARVQLNLQIGLKMINQFRAATRAANAARRALELPPVGPFAIARATSSGPRMHVFSPFVYPEPAEWGPEDVAVGYFFLDDIDWMPPAELTSFLENGPPPVYVG
ncbi:MAG: glycosyltransferase, partial [Chloroflexota bacterium]